MVCYTLSRNNNTNKMMEIHSKKVDSLQVVLQELNTTNQDINQDLFKYKEYKQKSIE